MRGHNVRSLQFFLCILLGALLFFGACTNKNPSKARGIFTADTGGFQEFDRQNKAVLRARKTKLQAEAIEAIEQRTGATLVLNLFSDAEFEVVADNFKTLGDNTTAWSGHLVHEDGSFTLLRQNNLVSLTLHIPGKAHYAVTPNKDGDNLVYQFDPTKYGDCEVTQTEVISLSKGRDQIDRNIESAPIIPQTIKVLVLYTPALESAWGGPAGTELVINAMVYDTNQAYARSQIQQTIVATKSKITYTESGNLKTDLTWISSNAEVKVVRDNSSSDCVVLLVDHSDNPTSAGIGYVMSTVSSSFEAKAFSVVVGAPARDNWSFAHELAHNMGACHTLGDPSCTTPAYPYSYGWRFDVGGVKLRTIMAYAPGERIGYFSNPDVKYNGVATGNPDTLPNPSNNAKTLNNTASTVASFR